jgi:hypothetical protein
MAQRLRRQLERRESVYDMKKEEQKLVDATTCIINGLHSA